MNRRRFFAEAEVKLSSVVAPEHGQGRIDPDLVTGLALDALAPGVPQGKDHRNVLVQLEREVRLLDLVIR